MRHDSSGRTETGEPLLGRIAGHEARLRAMGIDRLAVAGSRAMGTARPDSDVDLIVHFRDGEASYFLMADAKMVLEDDLGLEVDLQLEDQFGPDAPILAQARRVF
jgi:predicted nucleotidyltransferase